MAIVLLKIASTCVYVSEKLTKQFADNNSGSMKFEIGVDQVIPNNNLSSIIILASDCLKKTNSTKNKEVIVDYYDLVLGRKWLLIGRFLGIFS